MINTRLTARDEYDHDKFNLALLNNHFENHLNKIKNLADLNINLRQQIAHVAQTYMVYSKDENNENSSYVLGIKSNNIRQQLNKESRQLIAINTRLQRANYDKKYYKDQVNLFSYSNQYQLLKQQFDSTTEELNLLKEQYKKQEEYLQSCKKQYDDHMRKITECTNEYTMIVFERIQIENSLFTLHERYLFEENYNQRYQEELRNLEQIEHDLIDHFNKTEFDKIIERIRQDYQSYNKIQISELEVYYKIKLDLIQYNFQDNKKDDNLEEVKQLQEENIILEEKLKYVEDNFQQIVEQNRQIYESRNDEYYELESQIFELELLTLQSRNNTVKLSSEINTYRCLLVNLSSSFQQSTTTTIQKPKTINLTVQYRNGSLCVRI